MDIAGAFVCKWRTLCNIVCAICKLAPVCVRPFSRMARSPGLPGRVPQQRDKDKSETGKTQQSTVITGAVLTLALECQRISLSLWFFLTCCTTSRVAKLRTNSAISCSLPGAQFATNLRRPATRGGIVALRHCVRLINRLLNERDKGTRKSAFRQTRRNRPIGSR